MIHFFPRFSKDAASTPLGEGLRATGADHRIFSVFVTQTYQRRIDLLVRGYPVLAWAAMRAARRSLLGSDPRPDAVVVSSDVEVLVFALVRSWPGAAKARIVLIPFIFTSRASGVANRLRLAYYRFVMRRVSLAICHSEREIATYEKLFARSGVGSGTAFAFVRWGTHVPQATEIMAATGPPPLHAKSGKLLVSAGKSGRDYPTLVAAMARLPCRLAIVCNDDSTLGGISETDTIELLRNCFGLHYLAQLLRADVVVVPLRVADISAGQMVFIQAMALGRPLIVTKTPTVEDYLEDGVTALLVPLGDVDAMAAAIRRLLEDPVFAAALGARAQAQFAAVLSGNAHLRTVVQTIERHCGIQTMARA